MIKRLFEVPLISIVLALSISITCGQSPSTETPRTLIGLSPAERARLIEKLAPTYEYSCMMHPEVHLAQAGTCPKCGMVLVTQTPSVVGEYKLTLTSEPLRPKAGEKTRLHFRIAPPDSDAQVSKFVINHEKLFHLFIVSHDLNEYQHIHPELGSDGTFIVEAVFPSRGLYKLHSDFFPVGGTPQVIHREIATADHQPSHPHHHPPLVPDTKLVKTIGGMTISLDTGSKGPLKAGALVPLRYQLKDERTGKPVRDLEPYLGAWGHTLILNADQSEYLHSHPTEMLSPSERSSELRGGPLVEFKSLFPTPGNYRIWTQFQRAGKVITVSFTVKVQA